MPPAPHACRPPNRHQPRLLQSAKGLDLFPAPGVAPATQPRGTARCRWELESRSIRDDSKLIISLRVPLAIQPGYGIRPGCATPVTGVPAIFAPTESRGAYSRDAASW